MKNKEINTIIKHMEEINQQEPWFGKAVLDILDEVDPGKVFKKPGGKGHSMIELLYHMITWSDFALKRIQMDKKNDMSYFEALDWRTIDPSIHDWDAAVKEFRKIQRKTIRILKEKDDSFLDEKVEYRKYNFRYLLQGVIEHTIYHSGQIIYINKML